MCEKTAINTLNQNTKKNKTKKTLHTGLIYIADSESNIRLDRQIINNT